MPRKIKLVISGRGAETDAPAVEDVLDQLRDYHDILKGVEEALAEDGKRAIDWRIVNASRNSPLTFEFEAFSHDFAVNIDRRAESVASATAAGMYALQTQSERPPYFNDEVLRKTECFFERLTNGIDRAVVDYGGDLPALSPTRQIAGTATKNIETILAPESKPYVENGSVEVFVLGVGIDGRGKRLLSVRSRLAGDEFRCVVSDEAAKEIQTRQIGEVWRNLRAELTGKIYYKSLGRISRVEAQSIRFFRRNAELPDIGDIQDESFTGGRRSEDFLERVRRGELS